MPLGHLSFLFFLSSSSFYWTYLPSVRRITYRLERRVCIDVHSFFMIATICSYLRQRRIDERRRERERIGARSIFLSPSLFFVRSVNCRYVFPETTLPRRQIPEYRQSVWEGRRLPTSTERNSFLTCIALLRSRSLSLFFLLFKLVLASEWDGV